MTTTIELTPLNRAFVPADFEVSAQELKPLYERLIETPLDSPEDVKQWLTRWSELRSVVDEERARRQIAASCDTISEDVSAKYLDFVRNIAPVTTEWDFKLAKRYYDSPHRRSVQTSGWAEVDRVLATQVELFDEKNVALETQVKEIVHEYDEIMGGMTIEFDGKEYTPPQMRQFFHNTDRDLRRRAFVAMVEKLATVETELDHKFDKLFELRKAMADNVGLPDYREVAFKEKRRDYTPSDCETFHDAIEKSAVPLLRKIHEERREALGVDALAPFDLDVDVKGRSPLRPFEDVDILKDKTSQLFHRIDPRLGIRFDAFSENMDIGSRKGKAPGAYQATLREQRRPFIFGNFIGLQRDLSTMVHEAGHAIHAVQSREQPLIWLDHAAMEFCEVSSMAQELLMLDSLDQFYDREEDRKRAAREQWESTVWILCWVAVIDGFQHWLYTNPEHTHEERNAKFVELHDRYMPPLDHSYVADGVLQRRWQRQLHIYHVPFYYVEYGIAQLGALQVYRNYRKDPRAAVTMLLEAQTLGGSVGAPRLFEVAGCKFDLGPQLLGELMDLVAQELEQLPV